MKNKMEIIKVSNNGDLLNSVKELFKAYQQELNENLCFQSFEEELENPLVKYAEPTGAIFLAKYENEIVGCIALYKIDTENCEMKRLYVKPAFRKLKIGEALVVKLLNLAYQIGYKTMKLDTLQKLQPAIKLYEKYGFTNTNAYYKNPLAEVVYMKKTL
jgi:putative acetyltransferase